MGHEHEGIIEFPVPILKGTVHLIRELRKKLFEDEYQDLFVVDFFDVAQGCKTYAEYVEKMKHVPEAELTYYGIALCGSKKRVNKLTGNLGLLR